MVLFIQAREGGFLKKNKYMMSKISNYIAETREEMKHVTWPTREQTIMYTIFVIVISIAISAYLGFFDYLFTLGLQNFISF